MCITFLFFLFLNQETLHASLGNVIIAEQDEVWKKKVTPKRTKDGLFLTSDIYTEVCEVCKPYLHEEIYLYNIAYCGFCQYLAYNVLPFFVNSQYVL